MEEFERNVDRKGSLLALVMTFFIIFIPVNGVEMDASDFRQHMLAVGRISDYLC